MAHVVRTGVLLYIPSSFMSIIAADRAAPPREELPIPTEPPFTAFIGNLPYDLTEDDLSEFFAPAAVGTPEHTSERVPISV